MFRLHFFILLYLLSTVDAAKILAIFPTPSISHQVVFRPLTQELARRGHEVTVITTDPVFTLEKRPENFTEIDIHNVSYNLWKERSIVFKYEKKDLQTQMETLQDAILELTLLQTEQEQIQRLINNNEKFDLLLLESWTRQMLIYSEIFKAPVILISSIGGFFGNEEAVLGVPTHPFLYPMVLQQKLYTLSFWEKLQEFSSHQGLYRMWHSKETKEIESLRQRFNLNISSYDELTNNIDMLFINVHPLWINNQPLPPNVITIWGIHKSPIIPLSQDLQKYLDSSKNGVIYLSFGSNVLSSTLPPEKIQILIRVFSRLKYDVLWKWETDVLPGKSDNIKISKWLPQSNLLKHPKIKLFITQGGLQSTDEAISAGVPMIGVPMFTDQWFNVEKFVYHKIGLRIDIETMTEEQLESAIHTVINDTRYRNNIIRLRSLMNDQPESSLERAVWWTEYVLRHGGAKHLRAAGANLHWTEYYEVDFVLKLISMILSLLLSLIISMYFLWKNLVPKVKVKTT